MDYYSARDSETDNELFQRTLSIPALIIYGADEPRVRREMFARAGTAMRGEFKVVEFARTGHWPHLENPDQFEQELLAYLSCYHASPFMAASRSTAE